MVHCKHEACAHARVSGKLRRGTRKGSLFAVQTVKAYFTRTKPSLGFPPALSLYLSMWSIAHARQALSPRLWREAVLRTVLAPHVQSAERGGALAECPASWLIRSHDIRQGLKIG